MFPSPHDLSDRACRFRYTCPAWSRGGTAQREVRSLPVPACPVRSSRVSAADPCPHLSAAGGTPLTARDAAWRRLRELTAARPNVNTVRRLSASAITAADRKYRRPDRGSNALLTGRVRVRPGCSRGRPADPAVRARRDVYTD